MSYQSEQQQQQQPAYHSFDNAEATLCHTPFSYPVPWFETGVAVGITGQPKIRREDNSLTIFTSAPRSSLTKIKTTCSQAKTDLI